MSSPAAVAAEPTNVRERIIAALDVATTDEARVVVRQLTGSVGAFKVGLQLFTAGGPGFVRELTGAGHRIFLDLKFHDIPNTVASAAIEAAKLGVWMFNVHAAGGREMMRRAADAVRHYCSGTERPLVIGVTVLTSSDEAVLSETGVEGSVNGQVERLAGLAHDCGLDGVVASAREVPLIRRAVPSNEFITVTPGIRGRNATSDDQRRVTTIGAALSGGSDYVVIGRPILSATDRRRAADDLVAEAVNQQ
jgi:orotidine-5'-phosphate decarboxylase